jgi:hypothetical protein
LEKFDFAYKKRIVALLSDELIAYIVLYVRCNRPLNQEVFMANPTLHITNGPSARALEQAFVARDLGAKATFRLFIDGDGPMSVQYRIYNFSFVTCHGPNYKLGGNLREVTPSSWAAKLPPHNFVFVEYNAETKQGKMEFSNAE